MYIFSFLKFFFVLIWFGKVIHLTPFLGIWLVENLIMPPYYHPQSALPPRLVVPGLELVYLWHGFAVLGQHYSLVEGVYVTVQEEEKRWRIISSAIFGWIINNFFLEWM